MKTELRVFSGSQFVGKPALVDVEFIPFLQKVNDFAAEQLLQVHVTSSARQQGVAVGNTIVPPATRSNHLTGHAIDMNVIHDGQLFNSSALKKSNHAKLPAQVRKFIQAIRDEKELRWGGDFGTQDPVHVDDGLNIRDALAWDMKFPIIQAALIALTRPEAEAGQARLLFLERPFISGPDVFAVQERLVALGFAMNPDGIFGVVTDRALTTFQEREGLIADGIVGSSTRKALKLT
ncbi:MAG: peptidoglycan-binding protein [Candidatus Accumulibacter phosphatis]|jgi:hypothetical protein|uniref:Peptidoglycan-binding protein n=1 Tax=Candidatus Accumulibacter phosphatis TaxID=327160 RepID=A0A6A7RP35_9PROT|nr:peptidoglycan-binding protein [Candidatus Accumulibacter phosphatis]